MPKVLLLLILGCLLPLRLSQAAFLQECEGVIVKQVPNPNPDCSEYIVCNTNDSYYCNGECTERVHCDISTIAPQTTKFIAYSESTTTPEVTSSLSSTTTALTTMSDDPHVICRKTNQKAVYPYPANENYYYECISRYLLLQQCPQNFHFDKSLGKCIGMNPYRL